MAKIVLLSPFFDPALAFQEWVVAKCLARAGHEVTVVYGRYRAEMKNTTPADDVRRRAILAQFPGIRMEQVACFGAGHTVFPLSGRRMRALCAGMDAAIVNAPGHGFGYRALKMLPRSLKAVVMFGDLLDNRKKMRPLMKRWKDGWYRWLFERADRLTYNTAECLDILREAGLGKHESRCVLASLPYDEEFFHLSEAGAAPRPEGRLRTLMTITRTLAHKPFDQWLPPVFEFLRAHPGWRYVFAGMGTDSTAERIRELVAQSGLAERVELLGMQDQEGMCRLYNEADLGLFPRATIGIQQAQATGLPVILPRRGTVTHLVQEGHNGFFFDGLENAAAVLAKAAAHEWPKRRRLAEESKRWSGEGYTKLLIDGLLEPSAGSGAGPLRVIVGNILFDERTNYQEVICAREFARMGFEVLVVAAQHFPGSAPGPWRVARVDKYLRVRDTIFFPLGLQKIVDGFRPHAAFLYAPNHGLSYALLKHLPKDCKVVPVFGDLRESHHGRRGKWMTVRGNPVIKQLIKDRWYRRLLKRADLILAVTNETVRLLREVKAAAWDARGFMCGLAADPNVFDYKPALRKPASETKIIVTVTRIVPEKPVGRWMQPVLRFLRTHPDWRYVFAGLPPGLAGEALGRELMDAVPDGRLQMLPLLSLTEMNTLFHEADLAVWYLPTISIQQSMLTGLPVLLPQNESVDHLVREGVNGFYYRSPDELEALLDKAAAHSWDRAAVAAENARLGSPGLFAEIAMRAGLKPVEVK